MNWSRDVPTRQTADGQTIVGPDAARYWAAAHGVPVSRPFHLRWSLPWLLGPHVRRWWAVWIGSWFVAAAGLYGWASATLEPEQALAVVVLFVALPGVLGPEVAIPVQCDLPATALVCVALWLDTLDGGTPFAIAVVAIAATMRETSPIWLALIAWNPVYLVALGAPLAVLLTRKPGPDPLGDQFAHINEHPIREAWRAHQLQWRDGWVMIAPWGVCLAALYDAPVELLVLLVVAYAQLLIATDTVRLYQHAAGPLMAYTAVTVIPERWLLLAVVVHVVWWRRPERI